MTEIALRRDLESLVKGLGEVVSSIAHNVFCAVPIHAEFGDDSAERQRFREVFSSFGSDKATNHSYHEAYPVIFRMASPVRKIIEIGIGGRSPYPDRPDGWPGQAGGSLHAWSRFIGADSTVLGLDIDPRLEIAAPNITTRKLDSLDREAGKQISLDIRSSMGLFDIVIDDGLHEPWAQINNLLNFLDLVRPGGFYVVEDLHKTSEAAISHVARLLGAKTGLSYSLRANGYGDDNALLAIRKPE